MEENQQPECFLPQPLPRFFDSRGSTSNRRQKMIQSTTTTPAVPCGLSIAASQPQTFEPYRARLLFCALLDEKPPFAIEFFKTFARTKPGEAAAALVAMAQGDGKTRQRMATLLENLYKVDKSAAINLVSLILRPQS